MLWLNDSHNGNKSVRNFSYHSVYSPYVSLLQFLKTLESSGWNLTKPTSGTKKSCPFFTFSQLSYKPMISCFGIWEEKHLFYWCCCYMNFIVMLWNNWKTPQGYLCFCLHDTSVFRKLLHRERIIWRNGWKLNSTNTNM